MGVAINNIVLASASPRRLELLRSLHLDVRVAVSAYAEPEHPDLTPKQLAMLHAVHKCRDVRGRLAGREIVVAADTVVDVDGTAYNKPADAQDAARMLHDLSGRSHLVHTAFALALPDTREIHRAL